MNLIYSKTVDVKSQDRKINQNQDKTCLKAEFVDLCGVNPKNLHDKLLNSLGLTGS